MASNTNIEYLDMVVNPYPGCRPGISKGCDNCWAEELANTRLRGRYGYDQDHPFKPGKFHSNWLKGLSLYGDKKIGVNFMGDLFGDWLDDICIISVINQLAHWPYITQIGLNLETKQKMLGDRKEHTYFFLTKRHKRMADILHLMESCHYESYKLIKNCAYFGFSICDNEDNINAEYYLSQIQGLGYKTWISFEPLLSEIHQLGVISASNLCVIGGESGKYGRPIERGWIKQIQNTCNVLNVPFYFKQWGSFIPSDQKKGKLDGIEYHEWPEETR